MKSIYTLLFLFITFCATAQNESEPNNTRATANNLVLNNTLKGVINPAGDEDWFKVTTTADGQLNVRLNPLSGKYMWIYLYDNDGATQLNAGNSNGDFTVSTDGLAAGTYFVKLVTYYSTDTSSYTISSSLTTIAQANDKEPDSTRALALTLPQNSSTTGHIGYYYNNHRDSADWYKITTNKDGLLKLTLTSYNGQYIWAYLYDNDGLTQLNAQNTNGTLDISTDGLAAGTYYVKIATYYNNGFTPYKLADTLYPPAQANDKEPNDTKSLADTLKLNSTQTGHINYYYNNHRDSSDWYKITTTADGMLRIRLTSENGQYTWAYLYDNDGTTQLNAQNTNGTLDINTDGLAAGTYYVRIATYYNTGFAPYTIEDSLFTYNPVDSEPNKYFSQAKTILSNRVSTGHVGFYNNNQNDTVDIHKINYTGTSGNLNLTFNLLPHLVDGGINYMWFQVYKDTSASPIFNQNYNSASTQINLTGLTQGYYYIKIFAYYNGQFEAYSVADSFVQVNKAKIAVNNSKTSVTGNTCGADSITYNLSGSHSPYTVRLYKDNSLYDSTITANSTVTFTGLTAGEYYATSYGDGATDSAYGKSETLTAVQPVPTGLDTSTVTTTTATLLWNVLSCANYYTVQYREAESATWTSLNTANSTITVTGLAPNTLYVWQVASIDSSNGQNNMSAYSVTDTFMTKSLLPVTFISFDGVLQNNAALLSWSTASEINNKGFEVQRSSDGRNFSDIAFVAGQGNSANVNYYTYTDHKIANGSNYYRLKQIDNDGKFEYSSVIRLDFTQFAWSVSGNPSNNSWVQLQLDKAANVSIQIISINGSIIQLINKGNLTPGTYSIPLNLSNAGSGIYMVRLIMDDKSYVKKIIK